MKNARQTAILSIIEQYDIETQEDLASKLKDLGIVVTQATAPAQGAFLQGRL